MGFWVDWWDVGKSGGMLGRVVGCWGIWNDVG